MLTDWLKVAERIAKALERMAAAAERQVAELDWLQESEKRLIEAGKADGFDAKMEAMTRASEGNGRREDRAHRP